ncbi:MAG: hypothetical protein HY356_02750 [Gammaproteobacteria bacterium]|nr:hypothetical protein [Gammaproteobacteria bacterium]
MTVTVEQFMERLGEISEHKGVEFARAHQVFDAEETYGNEVLKYKGYLTLSDAFKCFFLETVEMINVEIRPKVKNPLSEFYAIFVPRMAHSFASLCGAERVSIKGYPYLGYTLLRNIFDNQVLTSAALQRLTDFYSIEGVVPGKPVNPEEVKKLRKNTEYVVRRQMTGDQSGLSATTLAELSKWDALFDHETHGARLSAGLAMDWMRGQGPLPVLPKFEEMPFAMFVNRFCEVGWMFHHLVPLLQISEFPLSDAWRRKWQIIDESFEQTVASLTTQLGKPIGSAIIELVKAKFPFNEKSAFPL